MIFPWHTDLFQPGRTVCVVFRASPLIWPTSSGAHHAPRPLCLRATRCTPGGFPRGAMGVRGVSTKAVSSRTASADPGPHVAKSTGVPALQLRFGGDDTIGNDENTWKRFSAYLYAKGYPAKWKLTPYANSQGSRPPLSLHTARLGLAKQWARPRCNLPLRLISGP
jgi:hypothetical protein